jgi:hypothetical protein
MQPAFMDDTKTLKLHEDGEPDPPKHVTCACGSIHVFSCLLHNLLKKCLLHGFHSITSCCPLWSRTEEPRVASSYSHGQVRLDAPEDVGERTKQIRS